MNKILYCLAFVMLNLLFTFIGEKVYAQEPMKDELARVEAIYERIFSEGRFTTNFSEKDLASLPIGVMKVIGNTEYTLIIDSAYFTPQASFLNVYLLLDLKTSRKILFGATNIEFHPGGINFSTNSRLSLLNRQEIPISNKIDLIFEPNVSNYVDFDCNGFKSANLLGIFEFDPTLLAPDEDTGYYPKDPQITNKVRATFEVHATDISNIMAAVNFTPFTIPKVKGLSFSISDAIVDLSDIENPTGFQFPSDYFLETGENVNTWQGFAVRQVEINLFKELESSKGRTKITAQNMVIDKMGLSGSFGVTPLFGKDEGSLDGWPFSIDSLGVVVVKNQLKGGALKGLIAPPLFDRDDPMNYTAMISQNENDTDWLFSITPGKTLKASVLSAEIALFPNSVFTISKTDNKLKADAILFGQATIRQGEKINSKGLQFEQLHIATAKPYIRSGHWSLVGKGDSKSGGFPLSIEKLDFTHTENYVNLFIKGKLSLMNSEDKGFAAQAGVTIIGDIMEKTETVGERTIKHHEWKHKETRLSDIEIDIKGGAYSIHGSLTFYEQDKIYGDGFRGTVKAEFIDKFSVDAIAQFGNIGETRYWYVDGKFMVASSPGAGFGVYGFGGGLYYHMLLEKNMELATKDLVNVTGDSDKMDIGKSRSGNRYVPSADVGLGFKAVVIVGIAPDPTPFNGDASFEMAFNANGGVRLIRFRGEGYFITPITKRDEGKGVYADLDIVYDFENKALHATLDTYINLAGIIKGVNGNNLAGSAVMHFDPQDWYIHIGTPEQRIGLNFVGIFKATSYLMIGTYIHGMPQPPRQVSQILGDIDLDFMRDENKIAGGGGFAFGASMEVSTPRIHFLIFYGQFGAGAGFDIMLKNFGDAHCVGETGPIGINGWYAAGQAWAYVQGSIGIEVNLGFINGEFEILRIGAAAVLQAKLPNPTWVQGVVGGEFSILGGLVKGKCRFKVTIGEQCEIVGASALTGVKVISSVKPTDSDGEVSVFTAPQVAFNVPVNKVFEMLDPDNNMKAYKITLEYFKVKDGRQQIAGSLDWNENHDVAIFTPAQVLPSQKNLSAEVKVYWEEKVGGQWKLLGKSGEGEVETTTFKTGLAPKNIPEGNVLFSYPVTGQFNFYKNEYSEGFLRLRVGQDYLFNQQEDNQQWAHVARFSQPGQPMGLDVPVTYNEGMIRYELPNQLKNNQVYVLTFVKVPVGPAQQVDQNVTTSQSQLFQQDSVSVSTNNKEIQNVYTLTGERLLYESYLRTSEYNTFSEKLDNLMGYTTVGRIIPGCQILEPGASGILSEVFDKVELSGYGDMPPLISLVAETNNHWYTSYVYPALYQFYPVHNRVRINQWRREEPAGIPPLRAINIEQSIATPALSLEDTYSNPVIEKTGRVNIMYRLPYFTYMDFVEMRNKAVILYVDEGLLMNTAAEKLLTMPYWDIPNGTYNMVLDYTLPGLNKVTTSRVFNIQW